MKYAAILGSLAALCFCGAAFAGEAQHVSIKSFDWQDNDAITGFTIVLDASYVATVPHVPPSWDVSMKNNADGTTTVSAQERTESASLNKTKDGDFFHDFLEIELKPGTCDAMSGQASPACGNPQISGDLQLYDPNMGVDYAITLNPGDFDVQ